MYIYCCCTADCGTDHQLFTGKFRLKLKKTTRTVRSKLNPLCVCVCVCVCVTSLVAQTVKHLPTMWETWVQSLGREELLEKEMATHSSILAGKSHGRRNLVSYSPWGQKESDMTEQLHFHFHV